MLDEFYEQEVIRQLVTLSPDLLNQCSVSLLLSRTSNLLLINREDLLFDPILYLELVSIAQFIQKQCGNTRICIRNPHKQILLNWSSEEILELAEIWKIER